MGAIDGVQSGKPSKRKRRAPARASSHLLRARSAARPKQTSHASSPERSDAPSPPVRTEQQARVLLWGGVTLVMVLVVTGWLFFGSSSGVPFDRTEEGLALQRFGSQFSEALDAVRDAFTDPDAQAGYTPEVQEQINEVFPQFTTDN